MACDYDRLESAINALGSNDQPTAAVSPQLPAFRQRLGVDGVRGPDRCHLGAEGR